MIGEATHGSYDYYRIREQLTRRLIAECGFNFVGVEGDWPDCDRVHRSVTGAPGGAAEPQAALERFERWPTWMWANAEVARFCRWLRAWNMERAEPARVGFHGLDVYSLWESMQAIFDYLGEEDPASLEAAQEAYRCFEPYGKRIEEYGTAARFVSARCEQEVVRLLTRTREQAAVDGPGAFSAWQNAEVVAGAERYYRAMVSGGPASWNVRDTHMADTLDRLLDRYGPDARGVVWAHNTHVGDARATDMATGGMLNIGQLARERHGADEVVLIGFGSWRGHGDRRAEVGRAGRGHARAAGPCRVGGAAVARADAGPRGAGLRRTGPAGLGHRHPRSPGDRGGVRPVLRVVGQLRAHPAGAAVRRLHLV